MTEVKRKQKRPSKIEVKVKKSFRFSTDLPNRIRETTVKLDQDEYQFALENGCIYNGV